MPAAEPEIEPRCPGLVSKLPALSRRAMSRLWFRENLLVVRADPQWVLRIPQPADGLRGEGTVSTCRYSLVPGQRGSGASRCPRVFWCPCVCRPALPFHPAEQVAGSHGPFPPRCVHRTGQPAWLRVAAGSCRRLCVVPAGLAELKHCLAPQPQSLVRKKLKATQFWLISLCRPLTPPVTNPFIIALF